MEGATSHNSGNNLFTGRKWIFAKEVVQIMNSHVLRFSITKKIAVPFALILTFMAVMGVASLVGYGRATESVQALEKEVLKQSAAETLRSSFAALLMAVNDYVITGNVSYRAKYEALRGEVDEHVAKCASCHGSETVLTSDEVRSRLDTVRLSIDSVYATAGRIFRLESVRSNPLAGKLMEEMDYRYGDKVYAQVGAMVEPIQQNVTSAMLAVQEDRKWGFWLVLIPTLLALGISSVVVILTTRRISKPLMQLIHLAERITSRDFSTTLNAESEDEIGVLIRAFKAMADEIKRRYDELESFAYIVAHDLKNPIGGIRGMTEVMLTYSGEKLNEEDREGLRLVLSASDTMIALINDLLDFARAGKVEFASEPIPINRILDDVQRDMMFYIKERSATIVVPPGLPAVKCDPIRLSQIWKNLFSNAIKYNDNPHPRVEITCDSSQPHVHQFNVKDNGIGLNEKDFEIIFQPFKRATTTGKYEGTGIGLAIVKRVVDFHGGRIWVSSKAGEGTTFHFTLPKVLEQRVA